MKDISLKTRFEAIKKLSSESWFDAYYIEKGFDKLGITKKDVILNEIHNFNRLYIEAKLNGFINRMAFHEFQKNDLIQYAKQNHIDISDIVKIDSENSTSKTDKEDLPEMDYYLNSKLSELVKYGYFGQQLDLINFINRVFYNNLNAPKPRLIKLNRQEIVGIFFNFLSIYQLKVNPDFDAAKFKMDLVNNIENSDLIEKTIKQNWRAFIRKVKK